MYKKPQVLIVDDQLALRKVISLVLKYKYDVTTAIGAEEALEYMANNPVKLVLLDINMPKMDGITALKEIKQRHPETEVIMLSADATRETVRQAIKLGAYGFLSKPFNHNELIELVDDALKNGKIRR